MALQSVLHNANTFHKNTVEINEQQSDIVVPTAGIKITVKEIV